MSINLNPRNKYVIVEQDKAETKTASGLYLPDNNNQKPERGTVLAIGENVDNLAVGDKIVYKRWTGQEYKENGKVLIFIESKDILALVSSS